MLLVRVSRDEGIKPDKRIRERFIRRCLILRRQRRTHSTRLIRQENIEQNTNENAKDRRALFDRQ